MRHLGSLVLSLVLAPVIYVLLGIGLYRYTAGYIRMNRTPSSGYPDLTIAVGLVVAAALLYAVLALTRLSPVGVALAGLALVGLALWAMYEPASFMRTMSWSLLGQRGAFTAAGPITLALGVPLILTVFSPRRWRRHAHPRAAVPDAAPGYSTPTGYPGVPADSPYSAAPSYPTAYQFPSTPESGALGATHVLPGSAAPSSGPPAPSSPHPGSEPPDGDAERTYRL